MRCERLLLLLLLLLLLCRLVERSERHAEKRLQHWPQEAVDLGIGEMRAERAEIAEGAVADSGVRMAQQRRYLCADVE